MRHLLLLPLILGIASPTYADLGPADTGPKTKEAQQTRFDAWCIEKYADCVVSLEGRKLIVDKSRGINKSQLIQWVRIDDFKHPVGLINLIGPHHLYTYSFEYKSSKGKIKKANIVFQNSKYSDKFYELLKSWAPSKEYKCVYNFDTRKKVCSL